MPGRYPIKVSAELRMTWGLGLFEVSMVGQDANVTQVQLSRVVAQARRFVEGGGKEVSVGWGRRRCQWDGVEGGVGEGRSRVNPLGRHLGVGEYATVLPFDFKNDGWSKVIKLVKEIIKVVKG
ncbi:hypothetical protein Pmani_002221 [Petrolisthes manimaculis]|uniref:Uncharacterized protein n=1 Tax=Petrolisthes manimaculis TaxID=1843537 RepID=A0AAE1QJ02_9EUCA|nr:hypothetical protein Pmani_002221 [Petrolisthes manimaculis]